MLARRNWPSSGSSADCRSRRQRAPRACLGRRCIESHLCPRLVDRSFCPPFGRFLRRFGLGLRLPKYKNEGDGNRDAIRDGNRDAGTETGTRSVLRNPNSRNGRPRSLPLTPKLSASGFHFLDFSRWQQMPAPPNARSGACLSPECAASRNRHAGRFHRHTAVVWTSFSSTTEIDERAVF